jgi:hypothetical protein
LPRELEGRLRQRRRHNLVIASRGRLPAGYGAGPALSLLLLAS